MITPVAMRMAQGDETGTWVGGGLRREVLFFPSGGRQLYGSLYAASTPSPSVGGVAICNSWGFEGNQSDVTIQRIALAVARTGGACFLFHYPGSGDSEGDLTEASIDSLVEAATDALAVASELLPGLGWTVAGMMLGASIAACAVRRTPAERLLLVQPSLQPSRYFARLERSAGRAAARVPARAGNAYGYPLPRRILERGEAIDAEVADALAGFEGRGAVVRYAQPTRSERIPQSFEDVTLEGAWRFGARQRPELARAAAASLTTMAEAPAR